MAITSGCEAITKDSLLAARSTGPWQRAMIAYLFAQIEGGGLKNHPYLAADAGERGPDRLP